MGRLLAGGKSEPQAQELDLSPARKGPTSVCRKGGRSVVVGVMTSETRAKGLGKEASGSP